MRRTRTSSGTVQGATVASAAVLPVRRHAPEKREQAAIKRLLRVLGIPFYDLSQPRPTMQTAGLPDLIAFVPHLVCIEVKAPGGRQSPPQRLFQERCEQAGIPYVLGSTTEVAELLGLENPR